MGYDPNMHPSCPYCGSLDWGETDDDLEDYWEETNEDTCIKTVCRCESCGRTFHNIVEWNITNHYYEGETEGEYVTIELAKTGDCSEPVETARHIAKKERLEAKKGSILWNVGGPQKKGAVLWNCKSKKPCTRRCRL